MVTDAPLSNVIAVGCWEVSAFSRWRRARGHFQREFRPLRLLGFKQMHPRPPRRAHVSVWRPAVRWHGPTVIQGPGCAKHPRASEQSCQEGCQHLQRERVKSSEQNIHTNTQPFIIKTTFIFYTSYFLEAFNAKIYFICTFQAFLSKNAFFIWRAIGVCEFVFFFTLFLLLIWSMSIISI